MKIEYFLNAMIERIDFGKLDFILAGLEDISSDAYIDED